MKRINMLFIVMLLLNLYSCESEEFLPVETHEGKNTFGFISQDMVKRGGNIDQNDSVFFHEETGQFVFNLKTKSSPNNYGTWRFLDLHLSFKDYSSYKEYTLDSAIYCDSKVYSYSNQQFIDKSLDGIYYLDTTKSIHFWVYKHEELMQQISGTFDFQMIPKRIYVDTSFFDTTSSIRLMAGRFDLLYDLE